MAFIKRTLGEYFFVFLTLVIGLFATGWLAYSEFQKSNINSEISFKSDSAERVKVIENALKDNIAVINSVAAFYHSSDSVDKDEFSVFVTEILHNYPYIAAVDWAPVVKNDQREEFEHQGKLLYGKYEIVEKVNKAFIPRKTAEEYFPILYLEPVANRAVLGFDYASEPKRRDALTRASALEKIQVTAAITLVGLDKPGVLFFSPIFKSYPEDIKKVLQGFVVAVVPLTNIVDLAIEPLKPAGTNIAIYDVTNGRELLYVKPSRLIKLGAGETLKSINEPHLFKTTHKMHVAGREWEIRIAPADGHYLTTIPQESWMVLLSGILFTLLLCYYMIARIQENRRIVIEVAERTAELTHTKREVEQILNSTIEGIIGVDKEGKITFCNPITTEMLGYQKYEIINESFYSLLQPNDVLGKPLDYARSNVWAVLNYGGMTKAIDNEVFWKRNGMPLQVEYTASSVSEDGKITGGVIVFRDITQRKHNEQMLHHMASYDQLTNIPNRSYFVELLGKSIARIKRSGGKLAILYMDLNGFKPVNDTKGHSAGDLLLKLFADRIKNVLREHDTIARLGGDEFAILADNITEPKDCEYIAERINKALEKPFDIYGDEFKISTSIGIAIYPDTAETLDELITAADTAMYTAKKNKNLPFLFAQ